MTPPPALSTAFVNAPIERRHGREYQKQQRVGGGVQSEIKRAVHQNCKASRKRSRRNAAPEFIVSGATRETSAEKNDQKTQAQQSTHDSAVGQRLQVIVMGLLKTIESVARIVPGVDNAERAKA